MSSDLVSAKAALAWVASPADTASSKRRRKVRTRERRALFTSVRRAILRTAFLAPGVLAILQLSKTSSPGEPGGENRRRGYTQGRSRGQCPPPLMREAEPRRVGGD